MSQILPLATSCNLKWCQSCAREWVPEKLQRLWWEGDNYLPLTVRKIGPWSASLPAPASACTRGRGWGVYSAHEAPSAQHRPAVNHWGEQGVCDEWELPAEVNTLRKYTMGLQSPRTECGEFMHLFSSASSHRQSEYWILLLKIPEWTKGLKQFLYVVL